MPGTEGLITVRSMDQVADDLQLLIARVGAGIPASVRASLAEYVEANELGLAIQELANMMWEFGLTPTIEMKEEIIHLGRSCGVPRDWFSFL